MRARLLLWGCWDRILTTGAWADDSIEICRVKAAYLPKVHSFHHLA